MYLLIIPLLSFVNFGVEMGGYNGIETIAQLLRVSILVSLFYIVIYKFFLVYDISIIFVISAIIESLNFIINAFSGYYPHILVQNILSSICLLLIGYYLREYSLSKHRKAA